MFKLSFKTDSAAFDETPGNEIAIILRNLAYTFDGLPGKFAQAIKDSNGNTIGRVELTIDT